MKTKQEIILLKSEYQDQPLTSSQSIFTKTLTTSPVSNTCRLCATVSETLVPIFEGEGLQNELATKINEYLPIMVDIEDTLPLSICYQCMNTLQSWHSLVLCCQQADATLRANAQLVNNEQDSSNWVKMGADLEHEDSEDKDEKKFRNIKRIINEHMSNLNIEDGPNLEIMCHDCSADTSHTLKSFIAHLINEHGALLAEGELLIFLREHVIFTETLLEDSDRDAPSEPPPPRPRYHCPHCAVTFTAAARLASHLPRHAASSAGGVVPCCGLTHDTAAELRAHIRAAHVKISGEHRCMSCEHVAADARRLREHVRRRHPAPPAPAPRRTPETHQRAIPAVCPHCEAVFSNKYNMFRHMRRHGAPREVHACARCGRRYSTRGNLRVHAREAHGGAAPHACSYCGERFARRGACEAHSAQHAARRPLSCPRCGAAFLHAQSLQRHLQWHAALRPHACPHCTHTFTRRSHLNRHIRRRHAT